MKMKTKIAAAVAALGMGVLAGCSDAADVASDNLSKAADNFEVERRIVFFNGITDTYLLTIEGRCNIEDDGRKLAVTCLVGKDKYIKNYLGLSDNVSYFVEQAAAIDVDTYHYRVTFRPETVLPDVNADLSGD